jgi:hypothetical protein
VLFDVNLDISFREEHLEYQELQIATSARIKNYYIRASKKFQEKEKHDFIAVGEGANQYFAQLLLLFRYTDQNNYSYSLAWIQHLDKMKDGLFKLLQTAQVITISEIESRKIFVKDVELDNRFHLVDQ